jgi:hypothetical protein
VKRFLTLLIWFHLSGVAWGAITFDAQEDSTMFDALSFSWTHTIGVCSNNIVIVTIAHYDATGTTLSGVTVNGAAMSEITSLTLGVDELTIFYKTGASTGLVEATFTGSNGFAVGSSRSYCGVSQATPLGTAATGNDTGTTITVDVTSAVNEWVIDAALAISLPVTATVGAGQTERTNVTDLTESEFRLVESDQAGAASVTMSWTLGDSHTYLTIGVPLKPATAAVGGRRTIVIE